MAKLDWDKAGLSNPDPARVQDVKDYFIRPKAKKIKKKKSTTKSTLSKKEVEKQEQAEALKRRRLADAFYAKEQRKLDRINRARRVKKSPSN